MWEFLKNRGEEHVNVPSPKYRADTPNLAGHGLGDVPVGTGIFVITFLPRGQLESWALPLSAQQSCNIRMLCLPLPSLFSHLGGWLTVVMEKD